MCRQFNERTTATSEPNTASIRQFALCGLWSRTYTIYLQFRIFRLQYSTKRICADILDISTTQCALYCKHGAKYSAHPPVYAIWTVIPDTYNGISVQHNQASIFKWTYLRCYWRYVDNSMFVILQSWCQYSVQSPAYAMWTVVPYIYNAFTAPHIQASIFKWTYLRCYWRCVDNSMSVLLQLRSQIQRTSASLHYLNCCPGDIQRSYSSAYSGVNTQVNVSAMLLEICWHLEARCTATLVPYIAHTLQFTLCGLWSRTYTMHLQLRIFRLQYLTERICAAIRDISTFQYSLYCKLGAKYSAHPPVYAVWTVVPAICNVVTALHIKALIFNSIYLRCYWTYCRHLEARCTTNLVPSTAYILQFTPCELWSKPYTMYLQLLIFRCQ
jgi:hypothetical protein